jgi:hypothetical protein
MVLKLERQGAKKNCMFGRAKLQNSGLSQLGATAAQSNHLHWYANGSGTRKEARQLARATRFLLADRNFRRTLHAAPRI